MDKLVLIADCGSTKCDWRALDFKGEMTAFETVGFNPSYMNADDYALKIQHTPGIEQISNQVTELHFYGSGCGSAVGQEIVKDAMQKVFTHAKISVRSDMLAAALAVYEGEPVICSILGTGSNSCRFDGREMKHCAPSLGFILGDEGSGNQIGQQLLRHYFYNSMPADLHELFHIRFPIELDVLIQKVYREPRPNSYLASFAGFAVEHRINPWIQQIVAEEFKRFLLVFVCGFSDYRQIKAGFIGSIAFYFEQLLRTTAHDLGINVSRVLQKPIDGLVLHHRSMF
jgi:N-acetylglucosamine kinase-like BadF-type ATPase